MTNPRTNRVHRRKKILLGSAGLLAVIMPLVLGAMDAPLGAQTQSPIHFGATAVPRFEVAAITPCKSLEGRRGGITSSSPGRLDINCWTVANLIRHAYLAYANGRRNPASALSTPLQGGPAWIDSAPYTIHAKAEQVVHEEMLRGPMLQALLEQRFQLKIHFGTTHMPVYALSVAKNGPKLRPFREGSCIPIDSTKVPRPRQPGECAPRITRRGATIVVDMQGFTLDEFIEGHLGRVDRPVVNKTGIAGRFDFHLEYVPDERTGGPPPSEYADEIGPSLFTSLQEQLGLKLEPAMGLGDRLIIDHVEKPSEN
jgi:bla regulator protein BlaR1